MGISRTLHTLIRHVALGSIITGSGLACVGELSSATLSTLLEDVRDDPEWSASDRLALVGLLARDSRATVRAHAGATLGGLLQQASLLERSYLVCTWASSPHEAERSAIAQALAYPFEAVGATPAVEHLAADPAPHIRRSAAVAARARLALAPQTCRQVLVSLARDADPEVRATALHLLRTV